MKYGLGSIQVYCLYTVRTPIYCVHLSVVYVHPLQEVAMCYSRSCKVTYRELSNLIRSVVASRKEVAEYDQKKMEAARQEGIPVSPTPMPTVNWTGPKVYCTYIRTYTYSCVYYTFMFIHTAMFLYNCVYMQMFLLYNCLYIQMFLLYNCVYIQLFLLYNCLYIQMFSLYNCVYIQLF